ncbi:MAG: family 43 glycosylhydrolase, partial [Flavisolibacter sp.]
MAIIFCGRLQSFWQSNYRIGFIILLLLNTSAIDAQNNFIKSSQDKAQQGKSADKSIDVDSLIYYQSVSTYVNPVLPGDHPDPTLLKVGDDFYHCGSSFHFTPYLPIYHSKDLIH